jgi:hypothetical protein
MTTADQPPANLFNLSNLFNLFNRHASYFW